MHLLYNTSLWITWGGLIIVAWLGDAYVEQLVAPLREKSLLRAADTVVHGIIGALTYWLNCIICPSLLIPGTSLCQATVKDSSCERFLLLPINFILSFGMAFILACIVDVDHISGDLIQMVKGGPRVRWERSYLHNSFPPLTLAGLLYLSSALMQSIWSLRLATLLIACVFSHHVRDGMHHGLCFNPLGITPKLPYWLYLALTLLVLPLGTSVLAALISGGSTLSEKPNRHWVVSV